MYWYLMIYYTSHDDATVVLNHSLFTSVIRYLLAIMIEQILCEI